MRASKAYSLLTTVLLGLALGACDDDDRFAAGPQSPQVGGPCADDFDCVSGSYCLRGGSFPDGTCTLPCDSPSDCPLGSVCIDHDRGVCLLECLADLDCRGGYECKERDEQGSSGKSRVCIH